MLGNVIFRGEVFDTKFLRSGCNRSSWRGKGYGDTELACFVIRIECENGV